MKIKNPACLRSDFLFLKQHLTCCDSIICSDWVVFDANLHKFWKQFTIFSWYGLLIVKLFSMQIYTNFESNSQSIQWLRHRASGCFRCKFTQILKAIHNIQNIKIVHFVVVFDANLHKFWKQFTITVNFLLYGRVLS